MSGNVETDVETEQMDQVFLQVRSIDGWLVPHACRVFAILDTCQKQHGVEGNLFEIGVWQGKSVVPLAKLLRTNETLGACDIFDDIGSDGQSNKMRRFRENIARCLGEAPYLRIYPKSSRELTQEEVTPGCRLIHIDGGHDAYNVFEDLVLAETCLHEKGAIVMDDAYLSSWPSVTDGIYRFLYQKPRAMVPLLCGFKKLVLVRPGAVDLYRGALTNAPVLKERFVGYGPYNYKQDLVMNEPTHVYFDRAVGAAYFAGLANAATKRLPWLRNRFTRGINRQLKKFRGW